MDTFHALRTVTNFLNVKYSLMFARFVWSFVLLQIADKWDNFQKEKWNIMYFTIIIHHSDLSGGLKLQYQCSEKKRTILRGFYLTVYCMCSTLRNFWVDSFEIGVHFKNITTEQNHPHNFLKNVFKLWKIKT